MAIPTPEDKRKANAAAQRASDVTKLRDSLTDALGKDDYTPSVVGHFADDIIAEVAAEFSRSGWVVTKTTESRSGTHFEIREA